MSDSYAAGEAIGRLTARVDAIERKNTAIQSRLNTWSSNIRRLVLVLVLWTLILTGATSTEDAAKFIAALVRKILV